MFVLGGGTRQGLPVEALLQLIGLGLLAATVVRVRVSPIPARAGALLLLCCALLAWLLAQALPLSMDLVSGLPGRQPLIDALRQAGVDSGRMSVSLDREATLRAVLAWFAPVGLFAYTLTLRTTQRIGLLRWAVGLAGASVLLGMMQLADGPDSALRWHAFTNENSAVGPFANRNHLASALAMSIPLATAALIERMGRASPSRDIAGIALAAVVLVAVVLGLALTRSRAGILLGGLAMLGSLLLAWRWRVGDEGGRHQRGVRRTVLLVIALGMIAAVQWGLAGIADRLDKDPLDDFRWTIAENTWEIAQRYGPLGTGAGTFEQLYEAEAPLLRASDKIVNRAHND
ncbi:MAG: O-antigen ligase family protein [Gammaproteobacteria bacterium]|nr:O-antigen ligase family protein [Gammaproteobacteria bacterium]